MLADILDTNFTKLRLTNIEQIPYKHAKTVGKKILLRDKLCSPPYGCVVLLAAQLPTIQTLMSATECSMRSCHGRRGEAKLGRTFMNFLHKMGGFGIRPTFKILCFFASTV